ncbi:MAG: hypothetical protein EZS28_015822 [Streblomastix strix]|uniref:Uncharacterized protein n=1 Tax=Streblomastix strix TaxID=222440 RepID=A0A5J4W1W2_9EUKA|nr:MAG: hypothetical protein EZS28_015822 [Streblomastix strix]
MGPIQANNRERIDPQINIGQDDTVEEEEDQQKEDAALIQNKDFRVNIISQRLVQENLSTQPQNNQGLNVLSQKEKDDSSPGQIEVQEKPKKGRGSKKSKTEAAPKRGKKTAEEVKPEPKTLTMRVNRSIFLNRAGTLQSREISVEISLWNGGEERADDNGSSGQGEKDWRIDIQREKRWYGWKDQKIHISKEANRERRIHKYWILSEIQSLEQLIKNRGKQNNNPIQGNIRREESISRNVERRVGGRNSNTYTIRPSEVMEPYISDKESQWNMEKGSGCEQVKQRNKEITLQNV